MLASNFSDVDLECGCDEAGRGCLAGPVVAAAVVFKKGYQNPALNDSKKLTSVKRDALRQVIMRDALAFGIGRVEVDQIDEINILNAAFLAMHRAIQQIQVKIDLLLIDGNRFKPYEGLKHVCIVKGDGKFLSIAAASILAKTERDAIMIELHPSHPHYGWNINKGYGTQFHRDALISNGSCTHHRKSFRLFPD